MLSMPVATRLAHDSAYLPQVESAYNKLRNMRPALRMQLLRDDNFLEEDDLRDLVENLANLVESFKSIAVGDDSDEDNDDDSGQSDYEY
jgi:hypothetical protein